MGRPGMRITLDAAMRARDVSRPDSGDAEPAPPQRPSETPAPEPGRRSRAAKNERRRRGKRGPAPTEQPS